MIKPDNDAAVDFLRRWAPEGPWVLTCIRTDKKGIGTATFRPETEVELRRWLEEHNGQRNIYFHVNPVVRDLSKKAEREDIAALAWLHVDIDPRAGEDLDRERKRALELLTTRLPPGVPAPTCVVFSGGGYQGFWRLTEPVEIGGDLPKAEDAKRYNQQLEILFGADNCHNIDRIMRLPGTVNLPDAAKKKKGREPALAELISFEDLSYPIGDFMQATAVQLPDDPGFSGGGGDPVHVPGNVERLADINELDAWEVPDRLKVVIVQGSHPDEPPKPSRSEWLFYAICGLIRCEVPDDVIFSVITDKGFGISASVLDKGSNATKYAVRQMERGKEEAVEPWLRKLNEQHAVIGNIGGKCRVVEEMMDHALKRSSLSIQSFEDFRNRYRNKHVQVGTDDKNNPKFKPVGAWWLDHPKRKEFKTVVFAPGAEVGDAYNLWKGFSYDAVPGDCNLFLDHVHKNLAGGSDELYHYLIGWMARAVRMPDSPGEVAVVLRGGRGTGKSFFAKHFGALFGRHFLHISNPSHLVGNFNSHLRDVLVLFADEAFFAGDKKHASILKTLITEETIAIEAKGVDVESAPNYVHLIMASNDQHVVPAGGDERRYLVLDVSQTNQQDTAYFGAIAKQLKEGGYQALLHHLMTVDLDDFDVRTVPQTEALKEQKLLSLTPEEDWWYNKLKDGRLLDRHVDWKSEVMRCDLVDDYVDHAKRWNVSRRGSETVLGRFMTRVCPRLRGAQRLAEIEEMNSHGITRVFKARRYFYDMPTLEECRERWEELFGPQVWPEHQEEIPGIAGSRDPF